MVPDTTTFILMDVSRLLSRGQVTSPTGIDRVEMAYARYLMSEKSRFLAFTAVNQWGQIGLLPFNRTAIFIRALEAIWRGSPDRSRSRYQRFVQQFNRRIALYGYFHGDKHLRNTISKRHELIYLLVSHHHLDRELSIKRLLRGTGARFICLIHDTIPLDFPEFTKRTQIVKHHKRLNNAKRLADAIIVNSESTKQAIELFFHGDCPRIVTAHLGIEKLFHLRRNAPPQNHELYFVCVGTIEKKKNQALLIEIWQKLRKELGDQTPNLLLLGQCRRDPESEGLVHYIEQSGDLRPHIRFLKGLSDQEIVAFIAGARATLLPSYAEGYGLTVPESLALGVPVLCSDLPALREVGGNVPEYFDPTDIDGWHSAIHDYAAQESVRRENQLSRLVQWRAPRWEDHFMVIAPILNGKRF